MKNVFLLALAIIFQSCSSKIADKSKCKTTIVTVDKVFYGKSSGIRGSYVINGVRHTVLDGYNSFNMVVGEKIKVCFLPENPGKVYFENCEPVFCDEEETIEIKASVKRVNRTFSFVSKGERSVIYKYDYQGYEIERSQEISLETYKMYNPQAGDVLDVVVSKSDLRRAVIKFPDKNIFFDCSLNM
jgi:hypothetical protein